MDPKRLEKLQKIQDWELDKPKSDKDWAEDVKNESLHVKYDYQLQEMLESHVAKIDRVRKDLDKFNNWPQVVRYGLTQQFEQMFRSQGSPEQIEGKTIQEWIGEEFEDQHLTYTWKVAKLDQSNLRLAKEIELRAKGYLEVQDQEKIFVEDIRRKDIDKVGGKIRSPLGTTYYVDSTNGNDANDGLGSTGANAWASLDPFTENARSAGDKVICRRGSAGSSIDNSSDLNFTSDGTVTNPIIIEADYDATWAYGGTLVGTATATLTFGSKTITFSADVSGVVAAGDWIYADGDSSREFLYEVASVVTTTVTLYLPYKGAQAGSGKTMYNNWAAPIWNTASSSFQWNFDTDNYWKVQGIHIRGTDPNGQVEIDSSIGHEFMDCILTGNGAGDIGLYPQDDCYLVRLKKTRTTNNTQSCIEISIADIWGSFFIDSCLFSTNFNTAGVTTNGGHLINVIESEFLQLTGTPGNSRITFRNITLTTTHTFWGHASSAGFTIISAEDFDSTVGDNRYGNSILDSAEGGILLSETTTVRSGGSNKSIKVVPTTSLSTTWDFNKLMVFEIPIYTTTDSKTYTVYFKSSGTGNWTNDPTASQLWIELEAWGHATNDFRKITKSTGTCDFNGTTDWVSLTVTVAPAQAGVAYLRCWYCKTKEAGSNVFYVDPIPVIS